LLLLHDGHAARLTTLGDDTVAYFRKLPGYDTLRLVLAERLVLVEGPSDALFVERAIRRELGKSPLELGIDIVSMGGLTFKRALEVCACLDRDAIALQDNDGRAEDEVVEGVAHLLDPPRRTMMVSDPVRGRTLEPQIVAVNDDAVLRRALSIADHADVATWMRNDKAEAALRLLDSDEEINLPGYIEKAVELLR
jgi:putative ATP-dependent endonuclease of OLD family